jgi:DNA-binding XRE family transcriptional regulator
MKSGKRRRLQAAGWRIGDAKDLLGMNDEEALLVELKLALVSAVKRSRRRHRMSQMDLARRMRSSQSRVAKIEAGDASVSLDLIVRALLATGASRQELQRAFGAKEKLAA